MARFEPHSPRTGSVATGGGLAGLAAGACLAALLLVGPIVLWARLGFSDVLGTAGVAIAASGLCWLMLRCTIGSYTRRRLPALERVTPVHTSWSPSSFRPPGWQTAAPSRVRRSGVPSHRGGPGRCCPIYVSRFDRDCGCRAAGPPLRRRGARRRTRP